MSKPVLPLIALVNTKSGGQDGSKLILKLQECMPKENVFDLAEGGPATGLTKCKTQRTRVLVCGGDGTVAWVLSEIKKMNFEERVRPVVAILPLGTANDLSRTLKWGSGWAGEKITSILPYIDKASVVLMDQWSVACAAVNDANGKTFTMSNYFSVGSDAEVALKFHKKREEKPNLFKNRTRNKGWYAKFALSTFLRAQPLSSGIEVELDGVNLEIPSKISILLVLNLPSYASGLNPWGVPKKHSNIYVQPSIDDGKFEIVGIKGLFHVSGMQMRMIKGKRLGQGRNLIIRLSRSIAAQVDGEPWLQDPTTIQITHGGRALMLANSPPAYVERPPVQRTVSVSSTLTVESVHEAAPSFPVTSSKLRTETAPVTRTMSASVINYGPVPVAKRKRNRYYCEICHFEFFLSYMLQNHVAKGCSPVEDAPSIEALTTSSSAFISPPSASSSSSSSSSSSFLLASSPPRSSASAPSTPSFNRNATSSKSTITLASPVSIEKENSAKPEVPPNIAVISSADTPSVHELHIEKGADAITRTENVIVLVAKDQYDVAEKTSESSHLATASSQDCAVHTNTGKVEVIYKVAEGDSTRSEEKSFSASQHPTDGGDTANDTVIEVVDTIAPVIDDAQTNKDAVEVIDTNQAANQATAGDVPSNDVAVEVESTNKVAADEVQVNFLLMEKSEEKIAKDEPTHDTHSDGSDDNANNNFSEKGGETGEEHALVSTNVDVPNNDQIPSATSEGSNNVSADNDSPSENDSSALPRSTSVGKLPKQQVWPVFQQRMRIN